MTEALHSSARGADLHNSKATGFTGDPAAYTPGESGILVVRTDVTPNRFYRTTGTTAGAVVAIGSAIYSGSGSPSSSLGGESDFYLDTATSRLYGPKTSGAWGSGVSLIGADGTDGADGADGADGVDGVDGVDGRSLLNGTGAPSSGTGANGDFYIDTVGHNIYGPKASGSWPSGISLVGPAGADGTDGTDGAAGADGADGADGRTILSGSGAPSSGTGADGDFYIDTVVHNLYGPKAAGSWPSGVSLVGPAGADGTDGAAGADGSDGAAGADGTDGTDGKTILNGTGAPGSGVGVDGDFYLDTTAHSIYGPKTSGAWGSGVSLIGPAGADGADGTDGTDGVDGTDGSPDTAAQIKTKLETLTGSDRLAATAIAGLATVATTGAYSDLSGAPTIPDSADDIGALAAANNLSDLASASTARTNLGLAIGTNVQAYDADLVAIAALTHTSGNFIKSNGSAWTSAAIAQSEVTGLSSALTLRPTSDVTGVTGAAAITNIISLSQSDYDAIGSKSSTTLYVIV